MTDQNAENSKVTVAEVGDVGLPEDLARADLYGLIARFFQSPPDQQFLDQIAATGEQQDVSHDAPLARAWMDVVEVSKNNSAQAWLDEFDANFISVGKPNIVLNGSFYMAGHLNERPLVNIRKAMEQFGLEAAEEVSQLVRRDRVPDAHVHAPPLLERGAPVDADHPPLGVEQ